MGLAGAKPIVTGRNSGSTLTRQARSTARNETKLEHDISAARINDTSLRQTLDDMA